MNDIIKANAEKGYIHLGSGEDFSLYKKKENGIDVYYIDEGYDCGALTVWNSLRGPEVLQLIINDMQTQPQQKEQFSRVELVAFTFWVTKYYFRKSEEDIWFNGCDLLGEEPLTTSQLLTEYLNSKTK